MTSRLLSLVTVIFAVMLSATACVPLTDQLKTASAGHTGCVPEQLKISNIRSAGGGLLWNATCNGKTYLCSEVASGKSSAEYSCALAQ
jgi:hypothetical protein